MKTISIDPITRLEGHGKIDIFLTDEGDVAQTYLQIPELRGFEKFCEGRPVEELPRIMTRICGVCPEAHHMASAKCCDAVYHVEPPPAAKKLRELLYSAFFAGDHATHFYALGGPDFVVGPTAPAAERNILGVIAKVGLETGKRVIQHRAGAQEVVKILGGKAVHPVTSVPGGVTKGLTEAERQRVETLAREFVEFGEFTLGVFDKIRADDAAQRDPGSRRDGPYAGVAVPLHRHSRGRSCGGGHLLDQSAAAVRRHLDPCAASVGPRTAGGEGGPW